MTERNWQPDSSLDRERKREASGRDTKTSHKPSIIGIFVKVVHNHYTGSGQFTHGSMREFAPPSQNRSFFQKASEMQSQIHQLD